MNTIVPKIILLLALLLALTMPTTAQEPVFLHPDTVSLSKNDIRALYYSSERDTLGFRALTATTCLDEYNDSPHIKRTLKAIQRSMNSNVISDKIAGTPIATLKNYPSRNQETLALLRPKYKITDNGIFIWGVARSYSLTNWIRMECYFVSFDKSVKLAQSFFFSPKPLPKGIITYEPKYTAYIFPEHEINDTTSVRINPVFLQQGEKDLSKFLEENIHYPESAIEEYITGRVFMRFMVNTDRTISDIGIRRANDYIFCKEIISVIQQMAGMWNPGTINGEKVTVEVVICINFRLEEL